VEGSVKEYLGLFDGKTDVKASQSGSLSTKESIKKREEGYNTMVTNFYDLVTDFYEWGWGQSFHFGPRWKDEPFYDSIKRAEYHLCSRLGMTIGSKAIDVGCGVGGPMRNMAVFSGSSIEGVTINEYQVKVGNKYNDKMGLKEQCHLNQGDFQNLSIFKDKTFTHAYAIEATCHSPNKLQCFKEVNRVLQKGGKFAGYEWVVNGGYDAADPEHVRIKEGIEVGNGLPTLATPQQVVTALEGAGFRVIEHYDANRGVHSDAQVPWYDTLSGSFTLKGFRMTHLGRMATHCMVWTLETLRIAPKGTVQVSAFLNATALDLVAGGKREIFTPSYYFLAEKK